MTPHGPSGWWRGSLIFANFQDLGQSDFRYQKMLFFSEIFEGKYFSSIPVDSAHFCFHRVFKLRPVPIATAAAAFPDASTLSGARALTVATKDLFSALLTAFTPPPLAVLFF